MSFQLLNIGLKNNVLPFVNTVRSRRLLKQNNICVSLNVDSVDFISKVGCYVYTLESSILKKRSFEFLTYQNLTNKQFNFVKKFRDFMIFKKKEKSLLCHVIQKNFSFKTFSNNLRKKRKIFFELKKNKKNIYFKSTKNYKIPLKNSFYFLPFFRNNSLF